MEIDFFPFNTLLFCFEKMASVVDIKFVDESENFDFEKSGKQNSLTGPVITGSFEKRAPDPLTMGRESKNRGRI